MSSDTTGRRLDDASGAASSDSKAPLLPDTREGPDTSTQNIVADKDDKSKMRDFFRFSKKADEDKKIKSKVPVVPVTTTPQIGSIGGLRAASPLASAASLGPAGSPPRNNLYASPVSPGRQRLQSASPRGLSPSTSQIFERSVQEEVAQPSPQIPSHIITEDHIPPALDASSEAITNSKLDPDAVEIVTHANHLPAAAAITGATDPSFSSTLAHEEFPGHITRHDTDNVSNYGSLDVGDVRRLSFISFADVVHAEQELEEQRRDSTQIHSLGGHPALGVPRSPSPMRSPEPAQSLGASPSPSMSAFKFHEGSPTRALRGPASPFPGQSSPLASNELNIETMRQALRKTGSGDLSGFRSGSASAVGIDG